MTIDKKMALETEVQQREREISRLEIDIKDMKIKIERLEELDRLRR